MATHEPSSYACPFCTVVAGGETDVNARSDIVYRGATTTAFVAPKWWAAAPGHILVVSNHHYENIHSIPDAALGAVYETAKRVAAALRSASGCEGTSMRQHNEPGGGQDVWHFHVHVFPRRLDDRLYERNGETRLTSAEERAPLAARLRAILSPEA